ncbi:hypothetical protein ABPG75_005842 [Micractinium tetrahymenae]
MPAILAAPALSARPAGAAARPSARIPPRASAARWIGAAAVAVAAAAAGASRTVAASVADDPQEGSLAVCQLVGGNWEPLCSLANFEDMVAQHNSQQGRASKSAASATGQRSQSPAPRWLYKGI